MSWRITARAGAFAASQAPNGFFSGTPPALTSLRTMMRRRPVWMLMEGMTGKSGAALMRVMASFSMKKRD